ncbi:MAG: hypothetical protein JXA89_16735 [Anaerolineae bacterium]|nr:hypothetical protein [Anaerolineae bacterium]
MKRIQLIHWQADEAKERAARLERAGYQVDCQIPGGSAYLRALEATAPDAVVIDLSRLPSQGRDFALLIRKRKGTRYFPLVFVGGAPEKVSRIQELLPDALTTCWERIDEALEEAIANPPADPIAPDSQFAAYAGKPLWKKLGIKPNSMVGLIDTPPDFGRTLAELPEGVRLQQQVYEGCDLFVWFVQSRDELEARIAEMAALAERGPLWIAWPKKASRMTTDLTQQHVRDVGLATGLVDYKICSIDKTWSSLLFTKRQAGG